MIWPPGYKTFFHTQLITNFIMFINVLMPTIVGILTIISIINTNTVNPLYYNDVCSKLSLMLK